MAFEISRRMRLIEDVGGNWAVTVVGADLERTEGILKEFYVAQVSISILYQKYCNSFANILFFSL
jgi:hypothetical protein